MGQLQRVQINSYLAFYLHDALIGVWLIGTLFFHRSDWQRGFNHLQKTISPSIKILATFIGVSTIISFAVYSTITPLLYLGRCALYILFGASLSFTVTLSKAQQRFLWVIAGLLAAWLGWLQYLILPNTRFLWILGWDDHYYRLVGPQLDPNFMGILLLITICYLWSSKFVTKKLALASTALLGGAIALTYSRATYLAGILSLGILATKRLSKKHTFMLGAGLFLCICTLLLGPKPGGEGVNLFRSYSIHQRLLSSQRALTQLKPHEWIVGKGLFQATNYNTQPLLNQHASFADNLAIFLITGLGVPGALLSIYWLYRLTIYLHQADRYVWAAWIAVLIHAQFNNTLFQPFVLLLLMGGVTTLQAKGHH